MKRSLIALAALTLAGCASLDNAGHSAYTVTAVRDAGGQLAGYELAVRDGKEYAGRQVQFRSAGGAVSLVIVEGPGAAFQGQAIAAKALSVMPVTGLADLLK